jgi:copper(I)-binding protein
MPALLAGAALCLVCGACAGAPTLRVEDAWVRSVPAGQTTAGYLTLVNGTADTVTLVGVDAPIADEVQMHETTRVAGRALMRAVPRFVVAPRARLRFAPGGNHLMLVRARAALADGDATELTLRFADGRALQVAARVRP